MVEKVSVSGLSLKELIRDYAFSDDVFSSGDCISQIRTIVGTENADVDIVRASVFKLLSANPDREFDREMLDAMFPWNGSDRYKIDYGIRTLLDKKLEMTGDLRYRLRKTS